MKRKILITDTAPLYPPLWGGPKRIWNLFHRFSPALFDITYVGVDCQINGGLRYSAKRIAENFNEILCALPPHYYFWHAFEQKIFKGNTLDLFCYLGTHTDPQFRYVLEAQKADVVICSHPWSSLSVKKKERQLFIYDAHNCEYGLMEQILQKHRLKQVVLKQVRRIESDACQKSDRIFVCSEKEKAEFIDLYRVDKDRIVVVPNGSVSRDRVTQERKMRSRDKFAFSRDGDVVIFIGTYFKPNREALDFIIKKIAPSCRRIKFLIVGSVSDGFDKKRLADNVIPLGRVPEEEMEEALMAADMAVNPMFEGSGINIKMLDYMAFGLPVVTTEVGSRGIETAGRRPFLVCGPEAFSGNIKRIFDDKELSRRMSDDARDLIADTYDWKKISAKAQDVISRAMDPL